MYSKLLEMTGQKCYTLTADNAAIMHVADDGIIIVYESGNELFIPRQMVVDAINTLKEQGKLTVKDVHEGITEENGARTDRLMAVLRKLPNVTFVKRPRVLYYNED